jgi:signal transduction histidine kinase
MEGNFYLTLNIFLIVAYFFLDDIKKEVKKKEYVVKLNLQLDAVNTRLRELDVMKSEFLSFAAHQLRSPLTAVRGYASMILEGSYGEPSDRIKDAVEKIFKAGTSLVNVVEDFLNITRIEQGKIKYNFKHIDVKKLVEEIIAEQKNVVEKAGLKLFFNPQIDTDYFVTADEEKIKQVVTNLLDNAVKYTKDGAITLDLERDDVEHKIRLWVADTGIGMPPELLPQLFTKFRRASPAAKINIRGTGLGLFIAKEIMKVHHGHIWAKSDGEGKGSTFVIELPLNVIIGS